ncbi:hypothetical protein [Reinekea marinisedimentorum]|uniref:Uncharacterized protein n=1 Tax=Reinekea marinisedimentorum TaxID=230495 RepID=A0A4R3I218_9GAMM|nr:hypothetical protein [Reinekea marinisedimentorum]TCS38781.1 hypothetical protein BCF53_11555 [Reinekea marinisedimentorum]
MSKVNSIKLVGDSTSYLSCFGNADMPNLAFKLADISSEGALLTDPFEYEARESFALSSSSSDQYSHIVAEPEHKWADFIAEQSIENDATYIFAPREDMFPEMHREILKAQVVQKTQYVNFYEQHNRKTGMIRYFEVQTGNWFGGISLIMWQAQKLLQTKDPEDLVSLTQLKGLFDKLSQRTVTYSIMSMTELNSWSHQQIVHDSLIDRIGGTLAKDKWVTHQMSKDDIQIIEKGDLTHLIDQIFITLMMLIERKALAFNRIIISCTHAQLDMLKETLAFQQIDQMQEYWKYRWVHQVPSITSQILTGKSAIHISCANSELVAAE